MQKEIINRITDFLRSISIEVKFRDIDEATFLPGILIENGVIIVDEQRLKFPGDLLHEAGHIALEPGTHRSNLYGNVEANKSNLEALETGVILWSWAALQHLQLPPEVVFHPEGYKGNSEWLIEQFQHKNFIGLPLLEWMGLTYSRPQISDGATIPAFPHMIKWLRD